MLMTNHHWGVLITDTPSIAMTPRIEFTPIAREVIDLSSLFDSSKYPIPCNWHFVVVSRWK